MDLLIRYVVSVIFVVVIQHQCVAVKWGCTYQNKSIFSHAAEYLVIKDQIIFGDDIAGAIITDGNVIKQLMEKIQVILQRVISGSEYNRLESILKFYNSINTQITSRKNTWRDLPFLEFKRRFLKYKPVFDPHSLYGILVNVLQQFVEENNEYEDHVYLVTAYANAPDHYVYEQMDKQYIDHTFIHKHVAGILKIKYVDKIFYILMDPIRGLVKPVLLMENETDFHDRNLRGSSYFRMLPSYGLDRFGQRVVLYPSHMIQSHNVRHNQTPNHHIYYIRQSFCSMMYATYKNDLLEPARSLTKKDRDGKDVAIISFNILQNITTNEGARFRVQTLTEDYTIAFDKFGQKKSKARTKVDKTLFDASVSFRVYPNNSTYKEKVTSFIKIFKNDVFLALYEQLINEPGATVSAAA